MKQADWVVAVRAAVPSPRPQGWQALQQAVGLAESGCEEVHLVADAGRGDGGPDTADAWLGRSLPEALRLHQTRSPHHPPLAGVLFRRRLNSLVSTDRLLLCRDPRVAASAPTRGRRHWAAVLMEWHVRPDPAVTSHRRALERADLHLTPAHGLFADLIAAGVPEERVVLLPNACGLSAQRARVRAEVKPARDAPVLALGLHRREGLDLALDAWASHAPLPPLWLVGRDQGAVRYDGWMNRIDRDQRLRGRVRLLGPCWGDAREDLLDSASLWLALYPEDDETRTRLCPLQVMDAAGSGLPVVASHLPSVRAALGDFPYGRVRDVASLVAAVQHATAQPRPPAELAAGRPRWGDRAQVLRDVVLERLEIPA
jgi:glycosyltransferase involved in cell wall biosynthesis